jgi:hypothetical protein
VQVRDAEAPARAIGLDAGAPSSKSCLVRGVDDAEQRSPDDGVSGESSTSQSVGQQSDGLGVVYSHDGVAARVASFTLAVFAFSSSSSRGAQILMVLASAEFLSAS